MAEKRPKTAANTRQFVEMVAEHNGWKLNPDPGFLNNLVEGLTVNHERYGFYLCPCRDSWGDATKDRDITCPCEYNLADQAEYGHCFCGLFLNAEFARSREMPQQIPERRPEERYPE